MTFDGSTNFGSRVYGGGGWLFSTPHLPDGALLMILGLVGCDTNTMGDHVQLTVWDCDMTGSCNPAPLTTTSTFDLGPGCGTVYADLSALNYTVDNQIRQLLVYEDRCLRTEPTCSAA